MKKPRLTPEEYCSDFRVMMCFIIRVQISVFSAKHVVHLFGSLTFPELQCYLYHGVSVFDYFSPVLNRYGAVLHLVSL